MKNNINPKTLKGQDKLNRMLDLMGRMNTLNESRSFSELELIKKGPNGIVYGIVRENHDYFIKTTNKNNGTFLAEDFNYIGGLQNKYDERYKSYADALKHLNIKFDMLNESYGIKTNVNIFESDGRAIAGGAGFGFVMEDEDEDEDEEKEVISDSDAIEEEKKVLKIDAPKTDEPVEDEVSDEPEVDMGGDIADMDFGDEGEEDSIDADLGDDEEGDDVTKKIQKYTGKIGQMLRDMDNVDADLEKYVINSIISAMHLDDMDEGDKEDIIAKLEGEEGVELDTEMGGDEEPSTEEVPDMGSEEVDTEEKPEETEGLDEGRVFSKKQIMESLKRRKTAINRKPKRVNEFYKSVREEREICERCLGEGCPTCMNEYSIDEELIGKQRRIDKNKNGRIDAEDFKMLRRGRKDRRRQIEEDEMSPFDAIETGQGYLSASRDLDRDFDGIPNRLDMDNNGDGVLDFSMGGNEDFIDLDIDFLRSNNPVKEPGIKQPTTKPGEGDKWRTIKKPKVAPKPKALDSEKIRPSFRRRGMFR